MSTLSKSKPNKRAVIYALMEDTFKVKEGDRNEEMRKWNKQVAELEDKLLKIDEMFVRGELEADSYKRLKAKASEGLDQARREIERLLAMDTNFMKYCRYGMTLLTHLDAYYEDGSLEIKRKLIGSIFTEKLIFENGSYQTTKVNEAVELIGQFSKELGKEKAGQIFPKEKMSGYVPSPEPFSNQFLQGMGKIYDLREALQRENLLEEQDDHHFASLG